MEINIEIDKLINKLDTIYKESHPNISNLWKKIIIKRYDSLVCNINKCNELLNILDHSADLSYMEMLTMYNVYNPEQRFTTPEQRFTTRGQVNNQST